MRPDQHKKKASARYQKKHKTTTTTANQDSKKSTGQSKALAHTPKVAEASSSVPEKAVIDHEEDNSDAVRRFSKRKVVSNWQRYEDIVCDEDGEEGEDALRGEDFMSVLNMAGNASSQLRLHDEADWAPDDTLNSLSCLAIDCEELASAIQCIPLHRRLNISEEMFSAEDIEAFKLEASVHPASSIPDPVQTTRDTPDLPATEEHFGVPTTDLCYDADEYDSILDDLISASGMCSIEASAVARTTEDSTTLEDVNTSTAHRNGDDILHQIPRAPSCGDNLSDTDTVHISVDTPVLPSSYVPSSPQSTSPDDTSDRSGVSSTLPSESCVMQSSDSNVPCNVPCKKHDITDVADTVDMENELDILLALDAPDVKPVLAGAQEKNNQLQDDWLDELLKD